MVQDKIEKQIEINASVERVWQILTDHREFGQWFNVRLDGPFVVGERSKGQLAFEGMEHLTWEVTVVAMDPGKRFAFSGTPHAVDPDVDYSQEPETLVEFFLQETADGCLLKIVESGFSALPPERGTQAFDGNSEGWEFQIKNIRDYAQGENPSHGN